MRIAALAALSLSAALVPTSAHALSCASGPVAWLPADGAVDIATDASIHVVVLNQLPDDGPIVLRDANGDEVAVTVSEREQGNERLLSLTPNEILAPNASYTLDFGENYALRPTFMTGSEVDGTPPAGPVVSGAKRIRKTIEWGPQNFVDLTVGVFDEPVLLEITLQERGGDELGTYFAIPYATEEGELQASIGRQLCTVNEELDGIGRLDVSVEAVDLSGNRSGGEGTTSVGACSAVAAPVSVGGLLLVGLVGLLRRRRG